MVHPGAGVLACAGVGVEVPQPDALSAALDLVHRDIGMVNRHAVDLDEILTDENAIVIIEWAERLGRYPLPYNVWRILIAGDGDEARKISIAAPNH